jgi:GAF domain-containing protein
MNVVYSVFKETDFAQNLYATSLAKSGITQLCERLSRAPKHEVLTQDFAPYSPSYNTPASFIGTTIYNGNAKIGYLVIQIPIEQIEKILNGNLKWKNEGLGETGEVYLIGQDNLLRSNLRGLRQDSSAFFRKLLNAGIELSTIDKIRKKNTAILYFSINTKASKELSAYKTGAFKQKNYIHQKVITAYSPIRLEGMNWGIIAEMQESEIFSDSRKQIIRSLTVSLLGALIIIFISYRLSKSLSIRVARARDTLDYLINGDFVSIGKDLEIGFKVGLSTKIRELSDRLKSITTFTDEIAKKNFDVDFEIKGEKDVLAHSLLKMRDKLKEVAAEEEIRTWKTQGTAIFANLLRGDHDDFQLLGDRIVTELTKYTNAAITALFVAEQENENTVLQLKSCYAYDRKKFLQKSLPADEGTLGQVFLEGKSMYLTEIPPDFVAIRSGLGQTKPRALLVVPMKVEEKVLGVIEISFIKPVEHHVIGLVEEVANMLAVEINSILIAQKTKLLLEQSREMTQQLQAQEEEMRQNMEELMATQEEMQRRSQEVEEMNNKLKMTELELRKEIEQSKQKEQDLARQRAEMQSKNEVLKNNRIGSIRQVARLVTTRIKADIDMALHVARTLSQVFIVFKTNLNDFQQPRLQANEMLKNVLKSNTNFLATFTLWENNAFDAQDEKYINSEGHDETGRFIPYHTFDGANFYIEPLVNYNKQGEGNYYLIPKNTQQETVINPYIYPVRGKDMWIISAVVPIIVQNQFLGICGIDFSIENLQKMINSIRLPIRSSVLTVFDSDYKIIQSTSEKVVTGQDIFEIIPKELVPQSTTDTSSQEKDGIFYWFQHIKLGNTNNTWWTCIYCRSDDLLQ